MEKKGPLAGIAKRCADAGTPVSQKMGEALAQIDYVLATNPTARWGTVLNGSNQNLGWVVRKNVEPVLREIITEFEVPVSTLLRIQNYPKSADIENLQTWVRNFQGIVSDDDALALDAFGLALAIIKANYSPPPEKKLTLSDEGPFCIYCFREIWDTTPDKRGADCCHVHADTGRTLGKYHLVRYQKLRLYLQQLPISQKPQKYILSLLAEAGIEKWERNTESAKWIESVLVALDVCPKHSASKLAMELASEAQYVYFEQRWPRRLTGTFLRYAAYKLATYRYPKPAIANKLNRMWMGESVSKLAAEYGNSHQGLHRLKSKWSHEIEALRAAGLDDDLIKLALNLEVLPPAK